MIRNSFDCFGSLDRWNSNCIVRGNNEKVETWELFHWKKWSKRIRSWAKNAVPAKVRTQHSGQIIIFHQPLFSWNKGISLTKPPFGENRSCEVAIIWPEHLINNWPYLAVKHVKKLHLMRWLFELTMFFGRNSWRRKSPFYPNLRCDFSIQPLYTLPFKGFFFCWRNSFPMSCCFFLVFFCFGLFVLVCFLCFVSVGLFHLFFPAFSIFFSMPHIWRMWCPQTPQGHSGEGCATKSGATGGGKVRFEGWEGTVHTVDGRNPAPVDR